VTWKLMIDDERDPPNVHREISPLQVYLADDWLIARTVDEAIALLAEHGYPELISFDHDLGTDPATGEKLPTGMDFAKHLVRRDMDVADMPADFAYLVHSMNGPGGDNIDLLLADYLAKRTPGVPVASPW
jgi:hypothetical protein